MLRKVLVGLNAAWIVALYAFCWSNNVSVGGFAFTAIGTSLRDAGLAKAAVAAYSIALNFVPEATAVYGARGYANDRAGRYEDAIADYSKAISLGGPVVHRVYNRASAYLSAHRYQEAIADAQSVIAAMPNGEHVMSARKIIAIAEEAITSSSNADSRPSVR